MNKRKPDDEFANINLSYINAGGQEVEVFCPETRVIVTGGTRLIGPPADLPTTAVAIDPSDSQVGTVPGVTAAASLHEKHFKIHDGETGHSYESMIGPYLTAATEVVIEDAYVRATHQVINFVRFCEAIVKCPTIRRIRLISVFPDEVKRNAPTTGTPSASTT